MWVDNDRVRAKILEGTLRHAPWSTLCSALNDFYVEPATIISGVGMQFYIDDSYVGQFVNESVGVLEDGSSGEIVWSKNLAL